MTALLGLLDDAHDRRVTLGERLLVGVVGGRGRRGDERGERDRSDEQRFGRRCASGAFSAYSRTLDAGTGHGTARPRSMKPRDRDRSRSGRARTARGVCARARLLASDDLAALRACAGARRRAPRRGRSARRRHREAHGPLAQGQVHRPRAGLRVANLVGRRQCRDLRGALRAPPREGRRASGRGRRLRRRRLRGIGSRPPNRGSRALREPLACALREDALHRPDGRRARGDGAPGARPPCAVGLGRSGRGRHALGDVHLSPPVARRGGHRRHVLRGGDQEVDLHRHERPPSARGRAPDALLGERRRRRPRRGLLRALGDWEDHAVGGSGASPHRRRRARLVERRRLQLRGWLLRQGDPALGGGRAGDLRDDARVRNRARERRASTIAASSISTTARRPRTRAPRTSSSRSRTLSRRSGPGTRARSSS